MKFEYLLAFRHLIHRRKRGFISLISFISIAGIAVGVMALIVVLSVMSGFDRELKEKIIGAQPHVLVLKNGGIEAPDALIEQIKGIDAIRNEVVSIAPYVEGQVIIRSGDNASGAIIKGMTDQGEQADQLARYIVRGEFAALFEPMPAPATPVDNAVDDAEETLVPAGRIMLGYILAHTLHVRVGDIVQVISPHIEQTSKFVPPRARTMAFEVAGIFEFGMNNFDSTLAVIALDDAQDLFNLHLKVSGIALRLHNEFNAYQVKQQIEENIRFPFWTQTWIDVNRTFFSALQVEKNVMTILLGLIILVAGFNIVSTLIMVVMEKTRDIGILRSLGATPMQVMNIFVFEGFVVGVIGALTGLVLGLFITFRLNDIAALLKQTTGIEVFPSDIYYFSEIPTEINPMDIALIVAFAFFVSLVAGLYPAYKAAHLNPVEALRYE